MDRRRRETRSQAIRKRSGPLPILKLVAYGLLLFLAVKLGSVVWEGVQAYRTNQLPGPEAADSPFPRLPASKVELDAWMDASLAAAIQPAVSPTAGTTAIYVKSMNTGASAAVDEDEVFPSASLFKVPILVEVLRQQSQGLFGMNTPIRLQQKHWSDGSGILQSQIGNEFPVSELLDLMISVSDNVAALALLDLVGTDNVNRTLQADGLEATRLRIGDVVGHWGGPSGENTTTAREMGILLEDIANGKILNEKASEAALRLLSEKQQASWLPDLLPASVTVAHKSGELPGVRHDAGIIITPRNRFVAVVLNSNVEDYDAAAATISGVAKAAYDYLELGKRR